jgi:hypothetical protein
MFTDSSLRARLRFSAPDADLLRHVLGIPVVAMLNDEPSADTASRQEVVEPIGVEHVFMAYFSEGRYLAGLAKVSAPGAYANPLG